MLVNDVRYASGMLRKSPVFTLAAVLRPLPFSAPNRLVRIFEKKDKRESAFESRSAHSEAMSCAIGAFAVGRAMASLLYLSRR